MRIWFLFYIISSLSSLRIHLLSEAANSFLNFAASDKRFFLVNFDLRLFTKNYRNSNVTSSLQWQAIFKNGKEASISKVLTTSLQCLHSKLVLSTVDGAFLIVEQGFYFLAVRKACVRHLQLTSTNKQTANDSLHPIIKVKNFF